MYRKLQIFKSYFYDVNNFDLMFSVGVLHLQGYTQAGQQTVHHAEERLRDDPPRSLIHRAM